MPIMNSALPRALAVTALLGGLALATPAMAASATSGTSTTPAAAPTSDSKHHAHKSMEDQVETRIKTLHDKLGITADQETEWNDVAQTMRDNEANIKTLIDARHQSAATMTAVEDLESYQKIAQAHADGLSKVAAAFGPVYESMSDDQKKNADEVFGRFEGHRGASTAAKASSKSTGK